MTATMSGGPLVTIAIGLASQGPMRATVAHRISCIVLSRRTRSALNRKPLRAIDFTDRLTVEPGSRQLSLLAGLGAVWNRALLCVDFCQ